jgi:hypothetical protein
MNPVPEMVFYHGSPKLIKISAIITGISLMQTRMSILTRLFKEDKMPTPEPVRNMKRNLVTLSLALAFVVLLASPILSQEKVDTQATKPSEGWILHIDAKKHFPKMQEMIAHHYCKPVSGGLTECQLYDSDKPDARLVGVEVIVDTETWNKFSKAEKALWHYHKIEIPKVDAVLPDVSPEESAKIIKGMEESYGKVYILWDPANKEPLGKPQVSILH